MDIGGVRQAAQRRHLEGHLQVLVQRCAAAQEDWNEAPVHKDLIPQHPVPDGPVSTDGETEEVRARDQRVGQAGLTELAGVHGRRGGASGFGLGRGLKRIPLARRQGFQALRAFFSGGEDFGP